MNTKRCTKLTPDYPGPDGTDSATPEAGGAGGEGSSGKGVTGKEHRPSPEWAGDAGAGGAPVADGPGVKARHFLDGVEGAWAYGGGGNGGFGGVGGYGGDGGRGGCLDNSAGTASDQCSAGQDGFGSRPGSNGQNGAAGQHGAIVILWTRPKT
ncbi:hypothetical protein [Streptomyces sp. NPDC096339]|uniref:hypothetical protein n=1 Tax=Streptomyces sp. NPDC096339 TaxID=3366086 RepID=UPI003813FB58